MNPLEAAATDLTRAQSELADATSNAERTASALVVLQGRLAAKQQDLANLRDRRLAEQEQESDAALAQLLALDIAGLEPLVGSAHAAHQAAQEASQQAQNALSYVQAQFERETAAEQATTLEKRLRELETMLLNGIAQLHTLKKVATGSLHIHGPTIFNFAPRLTRFIQTGVLA